jgi:beta-lactamase superfamily II metal-dependent hydrolase
MPTDALKPDQMRIRMYRVGFGDCFLMSLPTPAGHRHVLVDCGVHFKGDIKTMPKIVANIRQETKDHLNLVVVTHAHQDHISGFGVHAQEWAQVTADEIWMPWTEDLTDAQAVALRTKQLELASNLREHLSVSKRLTPATESILENFVGFNLVSNAESMRVARGGFKGVQKQRYLEAGDERKDAAGIVGLDVQVMSPSRDESVLRKMDPPAGQRWLRAGGASDPSDRLEPFRSEVRKRSILSRRSAACLLSDAEERELQKAVIANDALALMLDDVLNNTSLVLLFRYHGAALLFPGDAQWGSWSTWLEKSGADALLNEVNFFKVGHHGSHNSTPKTIVPKMNHPDLAAMISTQGLPFPSIPKQVMVDELTTQSHHRTVRSDWVPIAGAPVAQGPAKLPKAFQRGSFWIDYVRNL